MFSPSTSKLAQPIFLALKRGFAISVRHCTVYAPFEFTHNDWLSPTDVVEILKPLHHPDTLISAWEQYSCRRDFGPTEPVLALLIEKLAYAKRFDAMDSVMAHVGRTIRCKLSAEFFDLVIRAYGNKSRRIRRAIEVLLEMPKNGCWPNVRTFNFVLNLLVSNRLYEEAADLYLKSPILGVQMDTSGLNILLKALCESGDFEKALKVFDEYPHQRVSRNAKSYAILMNALFERGKVEEGTMLLTRMEEEGVEVDTIVYNVQISGLRKNGRTEEAVKLFDEMLTKGCQPNEGTYLEVLYGMIDDGKFSDAFDFMGLMLRKGHRPSSTAYKKMISGLCDENLVREAFILLEEMVYQEIVPRMGTWTCVVRCAVDRNNPSVCLLVNLLRS